MHTLRSYPMTSTKSMTKAELIALVDAQKDSLAEVNKAVEDLKEANSMLEQTAAIANEAAEKAQADASAKSSFEPPARFCVTGLLTEVKPVDGYDFFNASVSVSASCYHGKGADGKDAYSDVRGVKLSTFVVQAEAGKQLLAMQDEFAWSIVRVWYDITGKEKNLYTKRVKTRDGGTKEILALKYLDLKARQIDVIKTSDGAPADAIADELAF